MNNARLLTRGFSTLLSLYPHRFRQEFGEEMEAVFAERIQENTPNGPISLGLICLRELADLILNLFRERLADLIRGPVFGRFFSHGPIPAQVWVGAIAFGATAGLSNFIGVLSGLSMLDFRKYGLPAVLISFLLSLFFTGLPTWVFWTGAAPQKNAKGAWLPVLGASLFGLLVLIITILTMPKGPDYSQPEWAYWTAWREVGGVILRGAIFGGLLGYAFGGRRAVAPFAMFGALGRVLQDIFWSAGLALTARIFDLPLSLLSDPRGNALYFLWELILATIGGMIFGAALGWQASRPEKRSPIDGIVV